MTTNKKIILTIVIIAIMAGVFYVLSENKNTSKTPAREDITAETRMQKYNDDQLGISFEYKAGPDGYYLSQGEAGTDTALGTITLTDSKEYESFVQDLAAGVTREGPAGINILVFSNSENLNPESWVKANPENSLYNLILTTPEQTEINGKVTLSYKADGLYASKVRIISNNSRIYLIIAATGASEKLDADFEELISTLRFL